MKKIILLHCFIIFSFTLLSGCGDGTTDPPANSGLPIEFTSIPTYGSNQQLVGRVNIEHPENYKMLIVILVEGYGWVVKPTLQNPLTYINPDGSFTCTVVSGGVDEFFSCVAGFILPNGQAPPLLAGSPEIPDSMFNNYTYYYTLRYGRTINFASRDWWVKNTVLIAGRGPNYFSDNSENVWIENNRLHLKITERNGIWYCPEIICKDVLNYGKYVFKISSPVGNFDPNVVCGFFTWDMKAAGSHREVDIEFIKACAPHSMNSQYVIQPYNTLGNLHPWTMPTWTGSSSHIFEWKKDTVNFKSMRGLDINAADTVYQTWTISGSSVPQHNNENVRINLWLCNGNAPTNMQEAEVVVYDFSYFGN